ncbi:MAG: insulinase family protein [Patescibacteria group bacterium]
MNYIQKISSGPDFYYIPFPQKTNDVYLEINLKTGSIHGNNKELGIGHLLEHYLVGQLRRNKMTQNLETNGAVLKEQTNYYLKSSKNKILRESKYFLDGILNPDFSDKKIFFSEKVSLLNELNAKINSIEEQGNRIIFKARFDKDYSYSRTKLDELKNLKNKTIKDIKNYYKKFFIKSNLVITLSGYKLNKKIIKKVDNMIKTYAISKKKEGFKLQSCRYSGFKIIKNKNNFIKKDTLVLLTFPSHDSYEVKPWQRLGIDAVCKILSGSQYGLLNDLREIGIYNLTYERLTWRRCGLIIFASFVPQNKIGLLLELFVKKIKEIKIGEISKEKLRKILIDDKKAVKETFMDSIERLDWLTYDLINYGKIIPLKEDIKNINKIDDKFIKNLSNKILRRNKLNIIFLGKNLRNINIAEIKRILKF